MNNKPKLIIMHDIVEDNGKTIRENNLEKKHKYNVGERVEVLFEDFSGAVLFVIKQTRDCDGTPLYSLAMRKNETNASKMEHGFSEGIIK